MSFSLVGVLSLLHEGVVRSPYRPCAFSCQPAHQRVVALVVARKGFPTVIIMLNVR